jgi:hypothetical protein
MNVIPLGSTVPLDLLIEAYFGGVTGQSPTVIVQRKSDNYYWNGTTAFTPVLVKIPLVEVDAVNQPGLYSINFPNQGGDTTSQNYVIYYANINPTYPGNAVDELVFSNQMAEVDTLSIAQAVAAKILVNPAIPIDSSDIASQTTLLEVDEDVDNIEATMATQSSLDSFITSTTNLLNQILGIIQPVTGSTQVTWNIVDQNTNPVPGVRITVKNTTSQITLAVANTDINGQATLGLPPNSTFNVLYYLPFYNFGILPQQLIIGSVPSVTVNVTCTSFQPASTTPGLCNLYAYLMDATGNPIVGECLRAKLTSVLPFSPGTGMLASKGQAEAFSDASGFVQIPLIIGGTYEINSPALYLTITDYVIPNQVSLDLSTLLQFNS